MFFHFTSGVHEVTGARGIISEFIAVPDEGSDSEWCIEHNYVRVVSAHLQIGYFNFYDGPLLQPINT